MFVSDRTFQASTSSVSTSIWLNAALFIEITVEGEKQNKNSSVHISPTYIFPQRALQLTILDCVHSRKLVDAVVTML